MTGSRRVTLSLILAALLGGCATSGDVARLQTEAPAPEMRSYEPGRPRPLPPRRPNADMVQDFLELGFNMESGREIPRFSRFEGPVQIRTRGDIGPLAQADLDRLLGRLRNEARLDITRLRSADPVPEENVITVEFVPRRQMRAVVPAAACFVVPNVDGWDDFAANRRSPVIDWTRVTQRRKAAVFVPADTTPQEIRDCLHEEIAQALGPLNDLYRLTDSVFNDDNFQTTLTGFDMLVLRVWNAPELRSGMRRSEVAARLAPIFNRLNPSGRRSAGRDPGETPRDWVEAIEQALSSENGLAQRREGAMRALDLARAQDWGGSRLALSLMLTARLAPRDRGDAGLMALLTAAEIYRGLPGGEVHVAHLDMHLAVQALATGQFEMVLELTDRARDMAERTENAAFLASLGFIRAEALEALDQAERAERLRLDSMAAARYGFGSDAAARARMDEIARLTGAAIRVASR
ncbi:MAG: Protein of unknown function (DUF2927) [Rhodobacteraceae bacterium HLUCCA12]|nr:MAG: Protein of unknown function (DUF2927) [Rhodobacteraceae bacterium HLUCCA12]